MSRVNLQKLNDLWRHLLPRCKSLNEEDKHGCSEFILVDHFFVKDIDA